MIIPSIDLLDGRAVQLVGGEGKPVATADPFEQAEAFVTVGEIAVIDLDAALEQGDNEAVIQQLVRRYPCRVGGGIRSVERARFWLDQGAERVILGTAATEANLGALPRDRVVAALDARDGEIVVRGWREATGVRIQDRLTQLAPVCSQFMITFVEREGRMEGIDLERCAALAQAAGDARLTLAGGVTTVDEVRALDELGVDAQVGMALYTGAMTVADALIACLDSDRPDGLFATVVVDELGTALGLCWSSAESLRAAIEGRRGIYHSRTRGVWEKGASSGHTQELLRVDLDCDRDAARFTVRQRGLGFCHRDTWTCWGPARGLGALHRTLAARREEAPAGSYSRRLFEDPELLAAKLVEEAGELARATTEDEVTHEAADVLFFASVAMARAGVDLSAVSAELDRRARAVNRRPGDAKPAPQSDPQAGLDA